MTFSDKMDCRALQDFLNDHDLFCRSCGIRLIEVSPGRAVGELTVTPSVLNSRNVVQGGAIFTLADFTFAGAANAMGVSTVTQNCTIHFIRPGSGSKLTATATLIHQGKKTALCRVDVTDDTGKLISTATVTGCVISDQPVIEK